MHAAFVITIVGPRPWEIQIDALVDGTEVSPAPSWLRSSIDQLRAAIHDRLQAYAR
jgi:hypothetical protein